MHLAGSPRSLLADCKGWVGTIYYSHVMLHVGVWASSAVINSTTNRLSAACILERKIDCICKKSTQKLLQLLISVTWYSLHCQITVSKLPLTELSSTVL